MSQFPVYPAGVPARVWYTNGKVPSANPYTFKPQPGEYDPYAGSRESLNAQMARREADARKMKLIKGLATAAVGGVFAGPALGALYGSGAGPTASTAAGWSMPGVTAPTFGAQAASVAPKVLSVGSGATKIGKMATLGKLFNSSGTELGVNAGLSLLGMRSQNKAADQARADTLAANREALALQRQQLEMEMTNANLDREDARAAQAALNELRKRELDAAEEERAFNRSITEQDRAYQAPFREASVGALRKLQSMWGLG